MCVIKFDLILLSVLQNKYTVDLMYVPLPWFLTGGVHEGVP